MEIEVDGADRDLGLLRDHFDGGAIEAMLREDRSGGLEDRLSAGACVRAVFVSCTLIEAETEWSFSY